MFLKQEKTKIDHFEEEKKIGSKEKILLKISIFEENIVKKCPSVS